MGEGIYLYACVCKYICTLNLQIEVVNQLIGDVYIYIYTYVYTLVCIVNVTRIVLCGSYVISIVNTR